MYSSLCVLPSRDVRLRTPGERDRERGERDVSLCAIGPIVWVGLSPLFGTNVEGKNLSDLLSSFFLFLGVFFVLFFCFFSNALDFFFLKTKKTQPKIILLLCVLLLLLLINTRLTKKQY